VGDSDRKRDRRDGAGIRDSSGLQKKISLTIRTLAPSATRGGGVCYDKKGLGTGAVNKKNHSCTVQQRKEKKQKYTPNKSRERGRGGMF